MTPLKVHGPLMNKILVGPGDFGMIYRLLFRAPRPAKPSD